MDESSEERVELNEGFLCFLGDGVVRVGCWVNGCGEVVRRVWCSCLVERLARLGDLVVLDCLASCLAMLLL